MSVPPAVLQDHISYTAWASARLVNAAAQLSPEELTRDFQTADNSVLGTLVHLYFAERLWLARIKGEPFPGPVADGDRTLAHLQTAWPELHQRWRAWAESLAGESPAREVTYRDLKQVQWKQPLWQIVLHVVNHGTHHRGQVSGFIRAMGKTPPPLDLAFYHRGQR